MLPREQVARIRRKAESGQSHAVIARAEKVGRNTVWRIVNRLTHVRIRPMLIDSLGLIHAPAQCPKCRQPRELFAAPGRICVECTLLRLCADGELEVK